MSEDPNDDGADGEDPLADRLGDEDDAFEAGEHDPAKDPFERIGEGTGPRHGDPFDSFRDAETATGNAGPGEPTPGESGEGNRPDPAREGLPSGMESSTGVEDPLTGPEDPFTEFDEPATDPFGEGESVFDGATADDGVWERMESTDAEAEAVPGKRYVDVDKHSYCETCEYFSTPPEISCSHDGTEILEFVDMDRVRVANCPIVAERKALEDSE